MNKLILILSAVCVILTVVSITAKSKDSKDSKTLEIKIEGTLTAALEAAYFEGQLDALNSDIGISKTNDSAYVWTKSPWDSGKKPVFNPDKKTLKAYGIKLPK